MEFRRGAGSLWEQATCEVGKGQHGKLSAYSGKHCQGRCLKYMKYCSKGLKGRARQEFCCSCYRDEKHIRSKNRIWWLRRGNRFDEEWWVQVRCSWDAQGRCPANSCQPKTKDQARDFDNWVTLFFLPWDSWKRPLELILSQDVSKSIPRGLANS